MKQSEALDMITKIQLAHQAMESACKRVDELKEENKNLKAALAKQEQGEPTRHELQAKGEHPAPCARFCEANAFRIAERGYQRQICELSKKFEQLKQEQGEPVAWMNSHGGVSLRLFTGLEENSYTIPLYTTPPQPVTESHKRKPLTEEQLIDLWPSLIMHQHTYAFARAIEAAHGIKGDA